MKDIIAKYRGDYISEMRKDVGHAPLMVISLPLFDLLQKNDASYKVSTYCRFIEEMWRNGTDDVVNIVDVTIAERLSDDETVWNRFGENISNEFKTYINDDLLKSNIAMCGVANLV